MNVSNVGLTISKELFKTLLDKYKLKKFIVKEVLPKSIPGAIHAHPRILKLYKTVDKNTISLARNLVSILPKDIESTISFKKCRKFDKYNLGNELADHQKIVLKYIVQKFANKNKYGSYFCQMATGMGKTRLAISVIGQIGATTLVVVPTKHIAEQWISEIENLVPQIKVCLYTNPKNQSAKEYDITVIIINTARTKDNDFFSQYAFTILDEVHEHTSSVNQIIMWKSSYCRFVLGLSATPEDTKNKLLPYLESHLGKVEYSRDLEGYNILVKVFKVRINVIKYVGGEDYLTPVLNNGGTVSYVNTLAKIIEDPRREDILIQKIRDLYASENNILVFGEHREYLAKLYNKLIDIYNKNEINLEANLLRGGATKDIIENCRTARIILTTYCYSRRGIDYSHLTALVLATPRRSGIKQIIGRILRFKSDEKIPRYICDIWDTSTVLKSQFYERRKVYLSRKYTVNYEDVVAD